jgi:hypothetical protein
MTERSNHDEPLTSEDLTKCRLLMEGYCRRNDVPLWSSEAPRIEAIMIEICQHAKRLPFPLDELGSRIGMPHG